MTVYIACIGPKGGSGKSTTARLIATALVRAGFTAKIGDFDPQRTSLTWASKREDFRRKVHEGNKFRKPTKQIDVDEVCPRVPVEYFGLLDKALADSADYQYYIFDTAGRASSQLVEIGKIADICVMPMNPGGDDLWPTTAVYGQLEKLGISRRKLVAMLNRVAGSSGDVEEREARAELDAFGARTLAICLKDRVLFRSAMKVGLAPVEVRGKYKFEAEAVAEALINIINENAHGTEGSGGNGFEAGQDLRSATG